MSTTTEIYSVVDHFKKDVTLLLFMLTALQSMLIIGTILIIFYYKRGSTINEYPSAYSPMSDTVITSEVTL